MLKLSDLAQRIDFRLGPLVISPSRRHVEGPAGEAHVAPLVMQVFLLLLHARGKVVTRNELFEQCWGGVTVGDDSLNSAILGVRRIAAETAPGLFEIETIPRTGYRLIGDILSQVQVPETIEADPPDHRHGISRRLLMGSGAVVAATAGGLGLWAAFRPRTNSKFEALMAHGDEALRNGTARFRMGATRDETDMIALYEQAVRLDPRSARAWGLLAYSTSKSVDLTAAEDPARAILRAEDAVRRSLARDPKEPNALTAMILLQGPMLAWAERDSRLRDILRIDGNNILAMAELMVLLQAAGLTRESWSWNERILEISPLSRPHLVIRAQKLWILGKVAASDKVIDRVRGLWPLDEFGFSIRLMLFALTGRPRAALAMMENAPTSISAANFSFWRAAAEALETRTPRAIDAARRDCLDVARKAPWRVAYAVMVLCALGQTDAAFELTYGYLLGRGKLVSGNQADAKAISDWNRRMTPWLFTPPAAVMRADPRFLKLCEEFGLAAYWRARGVKPDYMLT